MTEKEAISQVFTHLRKSGIDEVEAASEAAAIVRKHQLPTGGVHDDAAESLHRAATDTVVRLVVGRKDEPEVWDQTRVTEGEYGAKWREKDPEGYKKAMKRHRDKLLKDQGGTQPIKGITEPRPLVMRYEKP